MRRTLARAALIEKHDAIGVWIVKLAVLGHQTATRPAMQKDHRLPLWIAALLIINLMNVRDLQPAGVIGLDWRVKSSKLSHGVEFIFEQPFRPANSSYGSFDCSAESARCKSLGQRPRFDTSGKGVSAEGAEHIAVGASFIPPLQG